MGSVHSIPGVGDIAGAIHGDSYVLGESLVGESGDSDGSPRLFRAKHTRVPGEYTVALFPEELPARPDLVRGLEREIRLGSLLRHPRIVQTFDFNATGAGPVFVVLEELRGRSLREAMRRDGMMPLPAVLDVVGQLVQALETAHALNIFHGDLHPGLIRLAESPADAAGGGPRAAAAPSVTLLGFGWGRVLRAAGSTGNTSPSVSPSLPYWAPEQRTSADSGGDEAADQYSLATVAYEMLAGCLPFSDDGNDFVDAATARRGQPPSLTEVVVGLPRGLDEPFKRALSQLPEERFAAVGDFLAALRAVTVQDVRPEPASLMPIAAPAVEHGQDGEYRTTGADEGTTPDVLSQGNSEHRGDQGDDRIVIGAAYQPAERTMLFGAGAGLGLAQAKLEDTPDLVVGADATAVTPPPEPAAVLAPEVNRLQVVPSTNWLTNLQDRMAPGPPAPQHQVSPLQATLSRTPPTTGVLRSAAKLPTHIHVLFAVAVVALVVGAVSQMSRKDKAPAATANAGGPRIVSGIHLGTAPAPAGTSSVNGVPGAAVNSPVKQPPTVIITPPGTTPPAASDAEAVLRREAVLVDGSRRHAQLAKRHRPGSAQRSRKARRNPVAQKVPSSTALLDSNPR